MYSYVIEPDRSARYRIPRELHDAQCTPEDLSGRSLTFTNPRSNSGFRYPLLILPKDFGLHLDTDDVYRFSQSHCESIRQVAAGQSEAAAVASDMLDLFVNKGDVDMEALCVVYESVRFPSACFGYSHRLNAEIATSVRSVLSDFHLRRRGIAICRNPAIGSRQF